MNLKILLFAFIYKFTVAQPDGAKIANGFSSWMMQKDRIFYLWWYPHPTSRTILLEVDFIRSPQVNSFICHIF